jgi:hypothetical protein
VEIWTRNVKFIMGTVAALLVAGVAGVAGVAVAPTFVRFDDQKGLRYRSQAALLAALPSVAIAELRSHDLVLAAPLGCWTMPEATPVTLRVACSGQTVRGKGVQVLGATEQQLKTQFFTILVEGRPLVQNAACLGTDCHAERAI